MTVEVVSEDPAALAKATVVSAWRCAVGEAVGGRGGVEADPMRRWWCRRGCTRSRSGHASGRKMIVARVKVRVPHTSKKNSSNGPTMHDRCSNGSN
jgi:hypothetical protein